MKKPKMILFDYGQTLVNEQCFDGIKGTEAVLKYAKKNKYNKSAEEVQVYANKLNHELGRLTRKRDTCFKWKFRTICLQNIYMSRKELKLH